MKKIFAAMLLALPMAVIVSCSGKKDAAWAAQPETPPPVAAAPQKSLYERLGGEAVSRHSMPWSKIS